MRYRKFGNTDLSVSEIGFGAWAIGGDAMIGNTAIGWGPADDAVSVEAIYAALDAGITFFDTADIYGLGHSEELLGKTLQGREVVIATKVGNVSRNNEFTVDYTKNYIIDACEQSLRRLKRSTIDYYQLHTARETHLMEGACIDAMQLLQQQGKVRYWGISLNTFAPQAEADFFIENHLGHGFQLAFNIINQKALGILKQGAVNGYGVIARMPLQFGLLAGKFNAGTQFGSTDHRRNRLTPQIIVEAHNALEPVWQLCSKYRISKAQLAISYVLSYKEVSTVIPGIRTKEHVAANTNIPVELEVDDRELIESCASTTFASLMEHIEQQG